MMEANGDPHTLSALAVEVEKGFAYSAIDRAFICQKKNHFQMHSAWFVITGMLLCSRMQLGCTAGLKPSCGLKTLHAGSCKAACL
jgi:hypothetical protein